MKDNSIQYAITKFMSILHTFVDGSHLVQISAKELISIEVWKGQRILDHTHANKIKDAVGNLLV